MCGHTVKVTHVHLTCAACIRNECGTSRRHGKTEHDDYERDFI
jgi:hypothetical protein